MTWRRALLAIVCFLSWWGGAAAEGQTQATSSCDALVRQEHERNQNELRLVSGLLKENCAKAKSVLDGIIKRQGEELDGIDALKVGVEVKHDHEKFVFGSKYSIRINIDNKSSLGAIIVPSEIVVQIPPELIINNTESELDGGPARSRNIQDREMCFIGSESMSFVRFSYSGINRKGIEVPKGSKYTMTWNCTEHTNFGNVLNSFIKMILFRPDAYTFTVSMPIYYESGGSLSGAISDVLSNIDPGSMPSADGASKKAKKASFDKEYSAASKTSDSEIETDLDRVFIYVASCMGAIGAVIVNAMFSAMLNYGERRRHSMREYSYYSQKLRFDHMAMIPVALIFSPLIVTATDFTHKLDRGMSIQIFDFFGAILAGFLVQMMIMKLAAQTTDKLLEKIMAREVRDDLP